MPKFHDSHIEMVDLIDERNIGLYYHFLEAELMNPGAILMYDFYNVHNIILHCLSYFEMAFLPFANKGIQIVKQ